MEYIAPLFKKREDAKDLPVTAIDSFMWDENGYKPESFAVLFAVENEGIYARLWSFEENVRCECTKRDDPVYTDSCLELFLLPVSGDERYINFEVNKLTCCGKTRSVTFNYHFENVFCDFFIFNNCVNSLIHFKISPLSINSRNAESCFFKNVK